MAQLIPNDVSKFIRRELRDKIERDFCNPPFRIFREGDLQACCYFHLRKFLKQDSDWAIYNALYLRDLKGKGKGAYPDLVLFRNNRPVFIIELKFRRRFSGVRKKDQQVLKRAVTKAKWAKKAYYLELVIDPTKETRRKLKPYRNRKITIVMKAERLQEYLDVYRQRRKPPPRK